MTTATDTFLEAAEACAELVRKIVEEDGRVITDPDAVRSYAEAAKTLVAAALDATTIQQVRER